MKVIAIRHAKPLEDPSFSDEERPLSEEGKIVHQKVMEELKNQGVQPSEVWCSPLLRALQTADIIEDVFGVGYEVELALGPAFNEHELMGRLQGSPSSGTIFLVGHAPTLADFCNEMAGDEVLVNGIAKSGAAIVEFNDKTAFGLGKLINYLKP